MLLPYWPHPSHNLSDDDERSPLRWNIMVIHHIMEVLQYDDYDKCSLGFQEVKGYDSTAIHLDHMLSLFPKSVLHLIMIPPSSSLASRGSKLYIASAVCVLWDQLICSCWRMTVWRKRFARSFLSIVCILYLTRHKWRETIFYPTACHNACTKMGRYMSRRFMITT